MSVKRLVMLAMAIALMGAVIPATALAATGASYWNVGGTYGVNVTWDQDPTPGTVYPETLILTQAGVGTITGTSICALCFTITGGTVTNSTVTFVATSPWTLTLTGAIAADGTMAGTWADGAGGSGRTGRWATTSGAAAFLGTSTHEQTDLVPYPTGDAVGAVIFNSSAGGSANLELTLQLKKVTRNTAYDVYLFLDGSTSGTGIVVGTVTTNGVGNGTFHVNTRVTPGIHTVGVDVTLHGSGNDVYVTPGLYGQDLFLTFR